MGFLKNAIHKGLSQAFNKKAFTNNPYLGLIIEADESDVIADELFRVGIAYQNGDYMLPKDNNKALAFYKKAAEKGHAVGQLFTAMGLMRFNDDCNDEVMHWLQKAAQQGERQAMYNLGISYHRGDINGIVDNQKSYTLIRKSAEKGYGAACARLATIYWNGMDGYEKNSSKSKFWALEAYGNGDEQDGAILKQVISNSDLIDGKINTNKIYDEAAESGEPYALYRIGTAYIEKDIAKAVELWSKASDLGNLYAKINLAHYYRQEKKDYNTANILLDEAAKMGVEEAQHTLAESYYYGLGVDKDVAKAWMWNEKAINFGYTPARYLLSVMCLQNALTDILPDKVLRGMSYMEQAAKDNYPPALDFYKNHEKLNS